MPKTLLIIGAGREQVPAYELAREKGLTVVGTDWDPDAPGFAVADHSLIASTRDAEETVRVVSAFAEEHSIDGVMTIANDVPYTVARVAEALGLPSIPSASAKHLHNKVDMKTCFQAAGVPTPWFRPLASRDELDAALNDAEFPLILKPSDGRGSRGVLYLDETVDLDWAWDHAMEPCENGILILETFAPGPQLSVEGMFVDGRYIGVAFADRNYDNLSETRPFVVEDGGIIPSRYEGEILEQINSVIEAAAKSLGISWGTVKADIVLPPKGPQNPEGGPQIIELAGRLSGNYLATHHIPLAYGIDIVGALMDLSLGRAVDPVRLQPKHKTYLGVRYFFPPAGVVEKMDGVEKVQARDYVHMLDIFLKPGDIQETIDNHAARAGTIICQGPDYDTAKRRVEACVEDIKFGMR